MPRRIRALLTACAFGIFFSSALVLGFLVAPLVSPFIRSQERRRKLGTRAISFGYRRFCKAARLIGLIDYPALPQPPGIDGDTPHVLIANHPTILDVVIILAERPDMICVAKGAYYNSWFFHRALRITNYVRGALPGEIEGTLDRVVESLNNGFSVLMFPEGTRSKRTSLQRFRRGAIEAAVRAGVPLARLFIGVNQPTLMRGASVFDVPKERIEFEWEYFPTVMPDNYGTGARAICDETAGFYRERLARHIAIHRQAFLELSSEAGNDASELMSDELSSEQSLH